MLNNAYFTKMAENDDSTEKVKLSSPENRICVYLYFRIYFSSMGYVAMGIYHLRWHSPLIFIRKLFFSQKTFLDYFYAKCPADFDYDS